MRRLGRRAFNDTLAFFGVKRRTACLGVILLAVGNGLGFLFLGRDQAMQEVSLMLLYTVAPVGAFAILVFLWNLWIAPYRIMDEKLDLIAEHRQPGQASIGRAVPASWKHVKKLELYQVAEISGGISPHALSKGSNDRARAVYSELLAALQGGELKGSDVPEYANSHTRIERSDLQRYFAGRKDCPEFLKD